MAADRLRFDYSHGQPLTLEERQKVSALVNEAIRANYEVVTDLMNLDEAKKSGAIALFDEKYENEVRVVSMGDFSKELCGGTHVKRTGDIGEFIIISDESIASGVRRIEAVCGAAAVEYFHKMQRMLVKVCKLMKADNSSMAEKAEQLANKLRSLEKENEVLKEKLVCAKCRELVEQATEVNGVKVIAAKVDNYSANELRIAVDDLKNRLKSCVVVLGSAVDGKVSLIAGVTADLVVKVKAGDLIRSVAVYVDGKGGGRPDMAQAGGTKPEGLSQAIDSVAAFLQEKL